MAGRGDVAGECRLIVRGGARRIDIILDDIRERVYLYNSEISRMGYYLKPVHRVYRRLSDGTLKIYEYYGRYYWRRDGKKLVYAGSKKPKGLPDIDLSPIEGLSVIRVGDDIIVDCSIYDKYKHIFEGLKVEKY